MKQHARRAWVVGMDCRRLLPLAPDQPLDWNSRTMFGPTKFHVMLTTLDRGIARFRVDCGGRVQSVLVTRGVPRLGKRTNGWRPSLSPWERPRVGIFNEDLAWILVRRSLFGGRKGARAIRRLTELNRQWLADERYLRSE